MSTRDEELEWLGGAMRVLGVGAFSDEVVESLYAQGVRVIDFRSERIVPIEDGPTLAEITAAWNESRQEAYPATVSADSSELTVDVKGRRVSQCGTCDKRRNGCDFCLGTDTGDGSREELSSGDTL
jgi:hypothetical protein